MAGRAFVVHSFELVNRKELAVELIHNKFLPSWTGKEVCYQTKCFYNRVLLRRPSREKEEKGVYICMLFVDTSKSGSSSTLCFGLLLQVVRARTRFTHEAVCKGQGARKWNDGANGTEKGTHGKYPYADLYMNRDSLINQRCSRSPLSRPLISLGW
jgi:hypothetical protein